MKTAELRASFLDFFQSQGHTPTPSASLIPQDPTLLFTTAGMVPFKDIFTGKETPPYQTATSCQKCVRAGGKHNDLEQVGYTARHHTFFEMLGNFSFGDYFKEKAILYAWTFLTKVLGITKEKLWITIYHDDEEAFSLWKRIASLSDDRIIRIATQDNFWAMGDTGPCGPCSEIFYDHGEHIAGGLPGSPNQDGDRFVELWNLVFMSFELLDADTRRPLAKPCVDTGMGIERAAAVLQGVHDNFETDILKTLIQHSADLSKTTATHVSHRVIVDHVRSSSFLIADGMLPGHEGRGYVLRRIIRRALRHAYQLGAPPQHLANVAPVLIEEMGGFYPELNRAASVITTTLSQEGERFEHLLEKGMRLLKTWLEHGGPVFPGEKAFQLYDTYGFPLDLTQDILREKNISVDHAAFYQHMEKQRQQSRASWIGSGDVIESTYWKNLDIEPTVFTGYDTHHEESVVQMILCEGHEISVLSKGQEGFLLTYKSPFYGESGGQIGDQGIFHTEHSKGRVLDTQKRGPYVVHSVVIDEGSVREGHNIVLSVDLEKRKSIAANHSATHLMHAALRHVLGKHVSQKGSLVGSDKLRFDFSHMSALTREEISSIEYWVNAAIWDNDPTCVTWMDREKALQSDVIALFGEKYDDRVRIVSMGHSKELCGGLHVQRTGDIGSFKIIAETNVAAGIRRIEAVTRHKALALFQENFFQMRDISTRLKVSYAHVTEKIDQLLESAREKKEETQPKVIPSYETIESVRGSVQLGHLVLSDCNASLLKNVMDEMKKDIGSGILFLVGEQKSKKSVLIGVTEDKKNIFNAIDLIQAIGTQGGGRPDLTQGPLLITVSEALERLRAALKK